MNRQFLLGERAFLGRFGLGLIIAALTVLVSFAICNGGGQLRLDCLTVFGRDFIKTVDFLIDLTFQFGKLVMTLGNGLGTAWPEGWGDKFVGDLVFLVRSASLTRCLIEQVPKEAGLACFGSGRARQHRPTWIIYGRVERSLSSNVQTLGVQ